MKRSAFKWVFHWVRASAMASGREAAPVEAGRTLMEPFLPRNDDKAEPSAFPVGAATS